MAKLDMYRCDHCDTVGTRREIRGVQLWTHTGKDPNDWEMRTYDWYKELDLCEQCYVDPFKMSREEQRELARTTFVGKGRTV